jgi:hypothetical protein
MSYVTVNTRTYTATHLATNMMRGFKRIIQGCGLSLAGLNWHVLEAGLTQFIEGRWLTSAALEVYDSTRGGSPLVGRFDFDLNYTYSSDGDGALWMDTDTVSAVIRKNGSYASRCSYRIVCDLKDGAPTPPGWSKTTFRSTDGFTRHAAGTAMGGGTIGAGLAYWKRAAS